MNLNQSEELFANHNTREKKTLFLLPEGMQNRMCALLDIGTIRNVISQRDYEALAQAHTLPPAGTMIVVAEKNAQIPMMGQITHRFCITQRM